MTSNNPNIQSFYDELESAGMGDMRASLALEWAEDACGGDALVLWGHDDYSLADSFTFATAAMQVCGEL